MGISSRDPAGRGSGPLLVAIFMLICPLTQVQAGEIWAPQLETLGADGAQHPTDGYRFHIPADVPGEYLQTLALELDGIDVTAMIRRDGEYAVFIPPQALAWGGHQVRIVQYAEDGSINELGNWRIDIRRSQRFREINATADISITAYQRLSQNLTGAPGPNTGAQGGANLQGHIADGNWQVDGRGNVLYDSLKQATGSHRPVDIGEYLLTGIASNDKGTVTLNAGHHAQDYNSLILQDFNRRGLSGSITANALHTRISAFAKRTDAITGSPDFFGVSQQDRRVDGLTVETQPLADSPQALYLSAGYVSGRGQSGGSGIGIFGETSAGDAWTGIADSLLFGDQVHLRGEYAASRFDFDGRGGFAKESDHAWHALASYTPGTRQDRPYNWTLGVETQRVGSFFRSLANPTLPADRHMYRVFGDIQWRTLAVQAYAARETDNVDDNPAFATILSRSYDLSLNYAPEARHDKDGRVRDWLGVQDYRLQLNSTRKNEQDRSALVGADATDNLTRLASLEASFTHALWSWGAAYSYSDFADMANRFADTRSQSASLNASIRLFGERLLLTPSAQFQTTLDTDHDIRLNNTILGLNTEVIMIPQRLTGGLQISMNRSLQTDDTIDNRIWTFGANLTWTLLPARSNHPGFDLGLSGSLQNADDRVPAGLSTDDYQVFMSLTMTAPMAY